jgi:hypothetical protein
MPHHCPTKSLEWSSSAALTWRCSCSINALQCFAAMFTWFAELPPHFHIAWPTYVCQGLEQVVVWKSQVRCVGRLGEHFPAKFFSFPCCQVFSGSACMIVSKNGVPECSKLHWQVSFLGRKWTSMHSRKWLIIVVMRSKACPLYAHPNTRAVGSDPIQMMDACLCLFCVCVGSRLAMGWSPMRWGFP